MNNSKRDELLKYAFEEFKNNRKFFYDLIGIGFDSMEKIIQKERNDKMEWERLFTFLYFIKAEKGPSKFKSSDFWDHIKDKKEWMTANGNFNWINILDKIFEGI